MTQPIATTTPPGPSSLSGLLATAGLVGRGGAGFSTARKLDAAIGTRADLIVNACDGEIGAAKDAWTVEHRLPELVAGAHLVAAATGGTIRYAAQRGSATAQRLAAAGLDVLAVPHRYVSSEESALVSLAHGGLAKPMTTRVPFVYGGRDRRDAKVAPTLVLNAETVGLIAQLAARGADGPAWFTSVGTPDEPGPRLVTVTGYVERPGVVQTAAGAALTQVLDLAGGLPADAQTVVVGGLGGIVLDADTAREVTWSRAGLAPYGGSTGAGVVAVLDPRQCPLDVVNGFVAYGAGESAGQCGPCMFGLPAIAEDFDRLTRGAAGAQEFDRLRRRLGQLPGRGACHHPDGVARFAGSALSALAPHVREHLQGGCTKERVTHE